MFVRKRVCARNQSSMHPEAGLCVSVETDRWIGCCLVEKEKSVVKWAVVVLCKVKDVGSGRDK